MFYFLRPRARGLVSPALPGLALAAFLGLASPTLPGLAAVALAAPEAAAKTETGSVVTSDQLRPPADLLVDCSKGPPDAKVVLPPALAEWAVVYCTKSGYIFSANDQHYAVYPETTATAKQGTRALFDASLMDGKPIDTPTPSWFKSIGYGDFAAEDRARLAKLDPVSPQIIGNRATRRLEIITSGDKTLNFLIVGAEQDPFWVFPLTAAGIGEPAFIVTSLKLFNLQKQSKPAQ